MVTDMDEKKRRELEQRIGDDYGNIAGIAVLKEGRLVYEKYFRGCTEESKVHVYSVTKSIISILIGIAVDKGYIHNINQKVLEFFPEYKVKKGETAIQDITIMDMLTMTAPYKYGISAPYEEYFTCNDRVGYSLDLMGGERKTGTFRYAPLIGPDILSGILVKATGKSVLDFATENLFSPLGIHVKESLMFKSEEEQLAFNESHNSSGWLQDTAGTHTAGWGLTLSPVDMVKIGQLYLNGGLWDGRRIVSGEWVEESTMEHSRWEECNLPYGYLWWINEDGYAAMGDGGNTIYVNTEKNIVVSIAAFFVPEAGDSIELIRNYIEPILD